MMDEMSEPVAKAYLDALALSDCNLVGSRFPWPLSATGSTGAGGVMNQLAPITASYAPALIAASGPRASYRFLVEPSFSILSVTSERRSQPPASARSPASSTHAGSPRRGGV